MKRWAWTVPVLISAALALSCVGARGQTDAEIRQTAHFAVAGDTLHNAFGDLASRMKKVRRTWRIQLVSANSIWCADLADFHRRHYGPTDLVIVIAGAVEAQEAFDQVQEARRPIPRQTEVPLHVAVEAEEPLDCGRDHDDEEQLRHHAVLTLRWRRGD